MAVMGRNLALNIEPRGYTVAIYNRSANKTEDVVASHPEKNFVPSHDVESFVNSIENHVGYADGASWSWYRCDY